MSTPSAKRPQRPTDLLIDEVRSLRRELLNDFDNDLGRLVEHLRQVQADYEQRRGMYANLPKRPRREMFPNITKTPHDPTHEEVQSLRTPPRRKKDPRTKSPH